MARIDKREVLRLLRKAVEEKGEDHVVPGSGCIYFEYDHSGEKTKVSKRPSCLVGYVAYLSGNEEFINLLRSELNNTVDFGGFDVDKFLTPTASEILLTAQAAQDDQLPWGEALKRAQEVA